MARTNWSSSGLIGFTQMSRNMLDHQNLWGGCFWPEYGNMNKTLPEGPHYIKKSPFLAKGQKLEFIYLFIF